MIIKFIEEKFKQKIYPHLEFICEIFLFGKFKCEIVIENTKICLLDLVELSNELSVHIVK